MSLHPFSGFLSGPRHVVVSAEFSKWLFVHWFSLKRRRVHERNTNVTEQDGETFQ